MKTATLKTYTIGLIASVGLTLAAYALVVSQMLAGRTLVLTVLAMAVAQLIVQMLFFLGPESQDRWNLGAFIMTLSLVVIVVGGSIWIMAHLNYAMMASPNEMTKYVESQQGF